MSFGCELYSKYMAVRLWAYLKPLVLENFLNCHHLLAVDEASLVDHPKGAISYNLYVCIGHFLGAVGTLAGCGYHRCHLATVSCEREHKHAWLKRPRCDQNTRWQLIQCSFTPSIWKRCVHGWSDADIWETRLFSLQTCVSATDTSPLNGCLAGNELLSSHNTSLLVPWVKPARTPFILETQIRCQ